MVIPVNKTKYVSFADKAEESCISMDEIFDMYNPSSNQNRATYFPNDEDKEFEKQIKEKAEQKRKQEEKEALKAKQKFQKRQSQRLLKKKEEEEELKKLLSEVI